MCLSLFPWESQFITPIIYQKNLSVFQSGRKELGNLIQQLSNNIDDAQSAITALKSTSKSSGEDLQVVIDASRRMMDELQQVNEVGETIANRLESLAQKNSRLTQASMPDVVPDAPSRSAESSTDSFERPFGAYIVQEEHKDVENIPSFFIQDRDYGEEEVFDPYDSAFDDADIPSDLQSDAERELYKALRKRKRSGRGA